jgi:hypothetical protein
VLRQIRESLAADGEALIADPYRPHADGFFRHVEQELQLTVLATEVFFEDCRRPLRIARFSHVR